MPPGACGRHQVVGRHAAARSTNLRSVAVALASAFAVLAGCTSGGTSPTPTVIASESESTGEPTAELTYSSARISFHCPADWTTVHFQVMSSFSRIRSSTLPTNRWRTRACGKVPPRVYPSSVRRGPLMRSRPAASCFDGRRMVSLVEPRGGAR